MEKMLVGCFLLVFGQIVLLLPAEARERPPSRSISRGRPARTHPQTALLESSCENKRADLVFIIDSSRSVNTHDYAKVKEFIVDILQFLDIGPDVTRVGLLQYGSTVKNEFSLKTFKRKSEVERAVKRMRHLSTGTMTGLAIQYALNIAFSEAEGARPLRENVLRVIMIVTDGRPQDSVAEVAAKARDTGILIFAIGVGQVDLNTLKAIGSEPHEDHVFLVANFSQMESLTSVFQNKLCSKSWSLDTFPAFIPQVHSLKRLPDLPELPSLVQVEGNGGANPASHPVRFPLLPSHRLLLPILSWHMANTSLGNKLSLRNPLQQFS
uniref:VWFA domain-containing protein n=1 Tax=Ursus americanus TaxID=9643 RepID=A0A452SMX8_URSAM